MFEKNFYCISSRVENSGQLYGCFKIGPFFGHQSLTFANALRRTLLADRNRCTFDAIQIYGVEHEFSSLIGVRESVIDILLNLEKLNFQITRPITKPQVAFLNFCGPGILRAQHLQLPSSLKCIVPEQYIATLEINGRLTLKLFFSPNWEKFQYNIQNPLWNKNTSGQTWHRPLGIAWDTSNNGAMPKTQKKIDRQIHVRKNIKTNLKYFLKHRSILQKKIRQPMNLPTQANPSIHTTFNNRLKIIYYLTNTLLSSNQDHLQLLLVQFQFWPRLQLMPNLHSKARQSPAIGCEAMRVFAKQLPLYEKLKKHRTQNFSFHQKNWISLAPREATNNRAKYFLLKPKNKQIKKKKFAFFKTQSKIKKQKVPILTQKIRENFLFLKSSFCTIKKVNYTLQSFDFQSSLTSMEKTIENTTYQPAKGKWRVKAGQNYSQKEVLNKNPTILEKSNRPIPPFDLNCTLKLNTIGNEYPISQSEGNRTNSYTHIGNTKTASRSDDKYWIPMPNPNPTLVFPPEGRKQSFMQKQSESASDLLSASNTCKEWTTIQQSDAGQMLAPREAMPTNTGSKIKLLTSKKKEFILFEVWTDGSLHPQTAILNGINELLFEIFSYSLQVFKYEKVHPITFHKSRSLKRIEITDLSKKHFREKFLNLEIGNFHFDLETYLFLKKIKIYRIIDFINFFSKKRDQKPKIIGKNTIFDQNLDNLDLLRGLQSIELQYTDEIKMTLYKFQIFIHSVLTIDPVVQLFSKESKSKG